jgi:hypothetical protein
MKRWVKGFIFGALLTAGTLAAQSQEEGFCSIGAMREGMTEEQFQARYARLRERGNRLADEERQSRAQRGEPPLPGHVVRIAYLIPSNRQPQDIGRIQYGAKFIRDWYADQMDRYGFGPKVFLYETEEDGQTPLVHVAFSSINSSFTSVFAASEELQNLGYPIFADGQVWMEFVESHTMNESGGLGGVSYRAFGPGSGSDGGAGKVSADLVAFMRPEFLINDSTYNGLIVDGLGEYPMSFGETYNDDEGETISQITSRALGITAHELGHGFGLHHCHVNNRDWHGDIMSTRSGELGIRGWARPELYPEDNTNLWYGYCLALNVNRYFNPSNIWTENESPLAGPTNINELIGTLPGNNERHFQASDSSGLACAWLHASSEGDDQNASTIHSLDLMNQQNFQGFFSITYPNGTAISVFDTQGNRVNAQSKVILTNENLAPQTKIFISPSSSNIGDFFQFDASQCFEWDGDDINLVEIVWDLDGDGKFDTLPTTDKILSISFNSIETRLIQAKLITPQGGVSISSPVGIRVLPRVEAGILVR